VARRLGGATLNQTSQRAAAALKLFEINNDGNREGAVFQHSG